MCNFKKPKDLPAKCRIYNVEGKIIYFNTFGTKDGTTAIKQLLIFLYL